jgi:hypothetical protein
MKKLLVASFFIFFSSLTFAQTATVRPNFQTEPPQNSRFEMIQSGIGARFTFRLDKFTGRVWQYVKGANDEDGWQEMLVSPKPTASSKPKFQIFLSGIGARYSFLIDNDNGNTWLLVSVKLKDGSDGSIWQKISDF